MKPGDLYSYRNIMLTTSTFKDDKHRNVEQNFQLKRGDMFAVLEQDVVFRAMFKVIVLRNGMSHVCWVIDSNTLDEAVELVG